MDFQAYSNFTRTTAIYPQIIVKITEEKTIDSTWLYPLIGLEGEIGELANKCKKIIRDSNFEISWELRKQLGDELGDILWYISELCHCLHLDLNTIAMKNIAKLIERKEKNKISGSGDNR